MSDYRYSALGHSVSHPDGDRFVFYYSENNGEWMVRDSGRLLYADQLNLILKAEADTLVRHLSEVS